MQEQSNGKGDVDADYDYEKVVERMRLSNPKQELDHHPRALVMKAELTLMLLLLTAAWILLCHQKIVLYLMIFDLSYRFI